MKGVFYFLGALILHLCVQILDKGKFKMKIMLEKNIQSLFYVLFFENYRVYFKKVKQDQTVESQG